MSESHIRTPAEVSEAAKERYDELATGDNPYPFEWRSFYNGYLEGSFSQRALADHGTRMLSDTMRQTLAPKNDEGQADNGPVEGELSGLPVEDQVRLYLKSGGAMAGAKALRAKLTAPPQTHALADLLKRLDKLERFRIRTESQEYHLLTSRRGEWVRFEQVKTIVGQWVAEQAKEPL